MGAPSLPVSEPAARQHAQSVDPLKAVELWQGGRPQSDPCTTGVGQQ